MGSVAAENLPAAATMLRAGGSIIVNLAPADLPTSIERVARQSQLAPSARDIASFTAQLAVMIRAGLSIRTALEGIASQTAHRGMRKLVVQVKEDVEAGKAFSEALARFPCSFSPLYVNMVKASEVSGGFPQMLDRIAGYLNQQIEARGMIVGAMTYPAIIATMAVATTIFLLMFVLPRFMILFAGHEAALPASTKLLLWLSNFLLACWPEVLGTAITVGWGGVMLLRTTGGRLAFDTLKLSLPVLRKMFRALYISRGLHTMGQLVNAGVPILQTIHITSEVSGNVLYRQMWRDVYAAVKQGKRINVPLAASPLLPRPVVQMISAGEESGRLGQVLDEVSDFYARELKSVIKTVTSLIEPVMILMMGGIVGFIATSIILPVFKLSQIMSR